MVNLTARIFDIQRFCLFDGEGIRTTVFFKGCPLRCLWCCNPESQNVFKELLIKDFNGCKDCLKCEKACEKGVLKAGGGVQTVSEGCDFCGECEKVCAFEKIKVAGKDYTVEEVIEIILKDREYYKNSSGGVTLSGGEVLSQADFAEELIKRLKKENVNVVI